MMNNDEDINILFVDWCASDVLKETQMLEPYEDLAYRIIMDFILSTNDNLPDDDRRLARLTKTFRKWKGIKQTLIDFNLIELENGFIRHKKVTSKLQHARKFYEQKRGAGIASAKKRKALKNKETKSTDVTTDVPTPEQANVQTTEATNYLTTKLKKKRKKKRKSTDQKTLPPPDETEPIPENQTSLWFDGDIITLDKTDYHGWLDIFQGNDDQFMDWLNARDTWLSNKTNGKSNWKKSTFAALNKLSITSKNQEISA
ncbi:MAG: DUF1376 domain-containing protein [Gammaproteobacteria bacterium]|nr:DUF1376 domain-containing protein [Gammaproteobacteria bacterium]